MNKYSAKVSEIVKNTISKTALISATVAMSVLLSSCGSNNNPNDYPDGVKISGSGSSFVAPLMQELIYTYNLKYGTKLSYDSTGSGTGMRQVSSGLVDFAISDVFMGLDKLAENDLYQTSLLGAGLIIVANTKDVVLDHSTMPLRIPIDIIAKIYDGKIRYWDNPEITKLNPQHKFAHKRVTPVYRSDSSGTTAVFTAYLAAHVPMWKKKYGSGKSVRWSVGVGADGSSNVINVIHNSKGAISYIGSPYHNKINRLHLTMIPLINKIGISHIYTPENLMVSMADLRPIPIGPNGWHFSLEDSYEVDNVRGYPYYAIEALILNTKNQHKVQELQKFVDWMKLQEKILRRYDMFLMPDRYIEMAKAMRD